MRLFGISNTDNFLHLGLHTKDLEGELKLAFPIIHTPKSFSIYWPEINVSCYSMILIKGFVCFFSICFQICEKFGYKLLYIRFLHPIPNPLSKHALFLRWLVLVQRIGLNNGILSQYTARLQHKCRFTYLHSQWDRPGKWEIWRDFCQTTSLQFCPTSVFMKHVPEALMTNVACSIQFSCPFHCADSHFP